MLLSNFCPKICSHTHAKGFQAKLQCFLIATITLKMPMGYKALIQLVWTSYLGLTRRFCGAVFSFVGLPANLPCL